MQRHPVYGMLPTDASGATKEAYLRKLKRFGVYIDQNGPTQKDG